MIQHFSRHPNKIKHFKTNNAQLSSAANIIIIVFCRTESPLKYLPNRCQPCDWIWINLISGSLPWCTVKHQVSELFFSLRLSFSLLYSQVFRGEVLNTDRQSNTSRIILCGFWKLKKNSSWNQEPVLFTHSLQRTGSQNQFFRLLWNCAENKVQVRTDSFYCLRALLSIRKLNLPVAICECCFNLNCSDLFSPVR